MKRGEVKETRQLVEQHGLRWAYEGDSLHPRHMGADLTRLSLAVSSRAVAQALLGAHRHPPVTATATLCESRS